MDSDVLQTLTTETALPLTFTLMQEGVGGVTGASVQLAIRNGETGMWLDFFDVTFKPAAWVQRVVAAAEVSAALAPGTYQYVLDVSAIVGVAAGLQMVVEWEVTAPTTGIDHDTIQVVDPAGGAPEPRISLSATVTGTPPAQTVAVEAALIRNGMQVVAGLVGATVTMFTPAGVAVFGPSAMAAQPNGYFSLSQGGLSLTDATNYYFEIALVDAVGPVTEFILAPTIGTP